MAQRHPFEVIQEASRGLNPGELGRGYGQSISDRLNSMGFAHTFDGLDRYKFTDPSQGIDTSFGTIDAIKNKSFVKGRRGAESQQIVFQPWHDKAERRALGMPSQAQGSAMRAAHSPVFGASFPGGEQPTSWQAIQDLLAPPGQSRETQPVPFPQTDPTMPAPIPMNAAAQNPVQPQPLMRRRWMGGY